MHVIGEFRTFLTKTNALALAIGVIIGAAVGNVVAALVSDILMPLVSLFLPAGDWRQAKIVLTTGIDAAGKPTENAILYGHFIGILLDFIIVAIVVFLIVRSLLREPEIAESMRKCPECMEMVPIGARRCRACTAALM
jgi:large conductance mechanosensitive channel